MNNEVVTMSAARETVVQFEISSTEILSLAIRKRRELLQQKESNLWHEIAHRSLIQLLCKELGKESAKFGRNRRQRCSSSPSRKRCASMEDSQVPDKKQRIYEQIDYEDHGLAIDESKDGDFKKEERGLENRFSYDSDVDMDPNLTTEPLSMVHYEFHPESKRFSRTSKEQLNGYVGQWSSTKFESSDIAEEPHVLMDLDKTAITQMSGLSLTEIQTGNTEPTEKTSSDELDLDDPLQMNDLFRQLYKSSYSIIESREVDLQEICGLLCAS
ncbi:hypothetical protein M3Y96_00713000 [Aphelenchoides besseyi]|nr:hypothetical protein M3Y96_00713000 [Aphelenchoides besseyi]